MTNSMGHFLLCKLIWLEWLKALAIALSALFLLFSVAELISGFLRTAVTSREVLINYLLFLPAMFAKILPLSCLLASLFSFHRLRSRNELIAILASGFSRKKFVFSILQIASSIMLLQFINVGYLDPLSKQLHKKVIVDGEQKFKKTKSKGLLTSVISSGKIWYRNDKYYVSYSVYDKGQKTLIRPTFFYFNQLNENTKIIKAERANGNEQGVWALSKVQIIENISKKIFPQLKTQDQLQLLLEETPSDFDRIDNDLNTLRPIALFEFVSQIKRSGILANEYEIFMLGKIVDSITCLIFALFPISIIFSPGPRNSSFGKNILFAIIFTLSYWAIHNAFLTLGNSAKIPPLLAAFAVSPVFAPCIFFTFFGPTNACK